MKCDNRLNPQLSMISLEQIPSDLLSLTQWVLWRWEVVPDREKPTKVPYIPHHPTRRAESNDPSTWSNSQSAYAVLKDQKCDGVGFVFSENDPYTGIDLDECRNSETGELDAWAQEIVDSLKSYTEISPSQTGVHILVQATLPPGGRHKATIEMYDSVRFFCMTGQHLEGTPLTLESRQDEVERLHAETFPKKQLNAQPGAGKTDQPVTGLTDEDVIQKAKNAKNASKFEQLWNGEWQGSYPSQSEADLALCGQLAFWTGHNTEQLDRLFRQSKLFRSKWETKHFSDGSTYGQKVIEIVLEDLEQIYQPKDKGQKGGGNPGRPSPPDLADGFMTMKELRDSNGLRLRWYKEEWLRFDGKIFTPIPSHDVEAEVMRYLQSGSARAGATQALRNNVLANLKGLCLLPHDVALPAQWDRDTWIAQPDTVVFENGILNIGQALEDHTPPQLLPHTSDFVSTVALPFAFDPLAQCPQWRAFLEQVLPDPDCRQLLRELFGYCLTYDTGFQKFFLFEGAGANGKGVVLGILEKMLGKANISSVPLEKFGASHGLETTLGKLVNITAEIGDMDRVAEGLLKQFTGNDLMHFNPKYRQAFSAKPTAKLVMATNVRPPFRDRSDGLWRRLIILPFPVTILQEERKREFDEVLAVELPGILNWAIGGAKSLRKRGFFDEPATCVAAREEFKQEANPARTYLEQHLVEDPDSDLLVGPVYQEYKDFCEEYGYRPLGATTFGREVKACFPGIERIRLSPQSDGKRHYAYKGVNLLGGSPCLMS